MAVAGELQHRYGRLLLKAARLEGPEVGDRMNGYLAAETCLAAAAILDASSDGGPEPDAEAAALLAALGYAPGDGESADPTECMANRRSLLRLAGNLQRLFRISPPDAPNLVFVGGEADSGLAGSRAGSGKTVSLSGAGLSLGDAFERCVGEGAEYLSQLESDGDIVDRGRPSDVSHGLDPAALSGILDMLTGDGADANPEIDWVAGRNLANDGPVLLPADLCLRRAEADREFTAPVSVGSGCAAGASDVAATQSAMLEVIERDAAALWWVGGRPPRPVSVETLAATGAAEFLNQLRGHAATRHTRLLDISTDLGVPCVAAVSLASDGRGFACGLAAGPTIGSAIRSAIVEMCQMELSHQVIALKRRQRGDDALNAHDLAHLKRGEAIDSDHPALRPRGMPNAWREVRDEQPPLQFGPRDIIDSIQELGAASFAVRLSRSRLSVPVSKVVAIGLQPFPSEYKTSRLKSEEGKLGRRGELAEPVPLL